MWSKTIDNKAMTVLLPRSKTEEDMQWPWHEQRVEKLAFEKALARYIAAFMKRQNGMV